MENINYLTIISIAFLGSFGHCIGMCGGIVLAYTSSKVDTKWGKKRQFFAHLLYSFGRISTYVFLGALFGFIGSVVSFSDTANGVLLIISGFAMLAVAISLTTNIKFLNKIEHYIQNSNWYHKSFKKILQSKSLVTFYILGLLNGLLPCGFIYFFAISAASTANPFYGAIVMLIFGLSTTPVMLSLGLFIGLFKQTAIRDSLMKLATIIILIYGGYTIYSGYLFIVDPNTTLKF